MDHKMDMKYDYEFMAVTRFDDPIKISVKRMSQQCN